ncbi:MAG: dihydrodipicolinate synthase family protein [Anaerolineales bacterium]|nr:dihydrodipicolinate synthase family protein [Anaerolineales bacterium]MDW8446431.1 dihydrodipicolinate synthase family protein [Anaerolineales bacterium]
MIEISPLRGIIAAAITPILPNGNLDVEGLLVYLRFLAKQGCHGALMLGTTGEGPSFSREEREQILQAALLIRQEYPEFLLLAGTGTPSLEESILLTKRAFSLGYDAVVVLPPYYFRNAGEEGLHKWFEQIFRRAVPRDGKLLLYHIPSMSGISLSLSFIEKLKDKYPTNFCGLKDSSGDEVFCRELGEHFGKELTVFTGKDNLLPLALQNHAAGSITAGANLFPTLLRQTWDAYQQGDEPTFNHLAKVLQQARLVVDQFPPASALVKGLLPRIFGFPYWQMRLPLLPLPEDTLDQACQILVQACADLLV